MLSQSFIVIAVSNISDDDPADWTSIGSGFKVNSNHIGTADHVLAPNYTLPDMGTLIWQPKQVSPGPVPQAVGFYNDIYNDSWLDKQWLSGI